MHADLNDCCLHEYNADILIRRLNLCHPKKLTDIYKDIFKNKIIYMLHKSISHNLNLRVIIFLCFFFFNQNH